MPQGGKAAELAASSPRRRSDFQKNQTWRRVIAGVADVDVAGRGMELSTARKVGVSNSPEEEPELPALQVSPVPATQTFCSASGAAAWTLVSLTSLPNMRRNLPEGLNFSTRWLAGSVT